MNKKINLEKVYKVILDFYLLKENVDKKKIKQIEISKDGLNKSFNHQINDFNEKIEELLKIKKMYLNDKITRDEFIAIFKEKSIEARSLSLDIATDINDIADSFEIVFD